MLNSLFHFHTHTMMWVWERDTEVPERAPSGQVTTIWATKLSSMNWNPKYKYTLVHININKDGINKYKKRDKFHMQKNMDHSSPLLSHRYSTLECVECNLLTFKCGYTHWIFLRVSYGGKRITSGGEIRQTPLQFLTQVFHSDKSSWQYASLRWDNRNDSLSLSSFQKPITSG